jgi:hypothetical protein
MPGRRQFEFGLFRSAGIAAALFFAFLAGIWVERHANDSLPPVNAVSISPKELRGLRKISYEIASLFADDFRWMRVTNNGNPVIVTGKRKSLNDVNSRILVRYVVLRKSPDSKEWSKVHVADLVTQPGEPVDLRGADSGSIWTFPTGGDVFAVQAKIRLNVKGECIDLRYDGGQRLLLPICVKTIKDGNVEYRVYQEIAKI